MGEKNIPEGGQSQCAVLASCYETTAEAIEKNTIRTTEAAFSTLRTATQTKIKPDIWGPFLDQLAVKVTERLGGSNDVRKLGVIFSEIANGLKAVSDTEEGMLEEPPEFRTNSQTRLRSVDFLLSPAYSLQP